MVTSERVEQVLSWGRCHRFEQVRAIPNTVDEARATIRQPGPVLPFGLGRSYGDSCLNDHATLVDTCRLDHFISFDQEDGELVCEAGVSLGAILDLLVARPRSDGGYWFLPVVPGTKFVTVGGAIANDVHGKNHQLQGTFGCHVNWLELARSDGSLFRCSADENADLFRATIGGLGLTGLITRASLRLMPISSPMLEVEHIRLMNLDDYFRAAHERDRDWSHHAAWVDVLANGSSLGRGIYTRSRFTRCEMASNVNRAGRASAFPIELPSWAVGYPAIKLFNAVYSRKLLGDHRRLHCASYGPALFPLDGILDWNRIYGKSGFYQYQCVVPADAAQSAIRGLLSLIAKDGQGSFLTVLKEFGDVASPGLLSFPMKGTTLAVDFPNRGSRTLRLLETLDEITSDAGGRIYPAKDGRSGPTMLLNGYPNLDRFRQFVDPSFSSTFWRRAAASQ